MEPAREGAMSEINYEKLRACDAEPLLEFEESLNDKIRREAEAKKRDAKDNSKSKGKRGRRR
jgi:hypothetical protein